MEQTKRGWKFKKQTIVIGILAVLLIVAGSYIGMGKYNEWRSEKEFGLFQQGAQYGYEQAVVQIAGMAISCEQVPLRVENQIINLIAVDCLGLQGQPVVSDTGN